MEETRKAGKGNSGTASGLRSGCGGGELARELIDAGKKTRPFDG